MAVLMTPNLPGEKQKEVEQLEKANELTPEKFQKMGYQSRLKLANENPALYKKLAKA